MILGFVLPDHLIGGGIDFHDGAAVGAGAMRAVVEDGNVAVGQPFHVVRAEKHLIAVVVVAGRRLAHAVGGGVTIAPDDLLGLAVDDIDFTEVARVDRVLIGLGIVADRIPVGPVGAGEIAHAQGQMPVDVDLVGACPDVVPHMPFPRDFTLGRDFKDGVGPDALKRLAVGPLSWCGHSVAAEGLVLGIAALGEGFVIRLVFPDQDGGVAVGQAIETVVRDLARIADLVFPDHLAVPRILAEQAVPAAEVHGAAGDLLRAEQVPVGKQFRIEGGMVMLPGMDNIAFHIDEVGLSAAWILDFVHNP